MKIKFLLILVVCFVCKNQLLAQKVERKGGFSYEFNFGSFNEEYNRIVNNLSYYQALGSKSQVAFRFGQAHLTQTGDVSRNELEKFFFRSEVQTLIGGSFRYYIINDIFSPMVEGRAGVSIGNKTNKVNPSIGLLAGYTFRINNLKSISLGYHIENTNYFSSTYHTDGTGESVYRVDNFHPIRKIAHNVFVNFIF